MKKVSKKPGIYLIKKELGTYCIITALWYEYQSIHSILRTIEFFTIITLHP